MDKASFYRVSTGSTRGMSPPKHYMDVMFNPASYQIDSTAVYSKAAEISQRKEYLQFSELKARTLSLDLYFDTVNGTTSLKDTLSGVSAQLKEVFFGAVDDVRPMVEKLHQLIEFQGDESVPPVVEFHWGGFVFRGVIVSMQERYDMFLPDGRPVKATVTVIIQEYLDPPVDIGIAEKGANKAANSIAASSEKEDFAEEAQKLVKSLAE